MATLATLQRKATILEQEARRRWPYPARCVTEDWIDLFAGDERDQVRRFVESIQPHLSYRDNGAPDLTRLTDDELGELHSWALRAKELEEARKPCQPV